MAFCPNCGRALDVGARFCSNCGTQVSAAVVNTGSAASSAADYKVILVNRGSCTKAIANDVLNDLLGYTDAQADQILNNLPIEVACNLTAIQAQYIAQAITEYGMEVAVCNTYGYVDIANTAMNTVYKKDGSLMDTVAGIFMGLSAANRITRLTRWTRPAPLVFRPRYVRPAPVPHVRRRVRPVPSPIPGPRPVPRPVAPRPAAPGPRPSMPPRPGGLPGGRNGGPKGGPGGPRGGRP
ncbi:MAG: zinc ribbon domain-containing protein [Clostridia bacterium]|nr:zinc ribbon domain-containing protein [Clostridia bacterium]